MAGRPNLSITCKIGDKWDCVNFSSEENHPRLCEFSWPAKNYSCSFCKRQFKSAQALGGHMNVHRRDRARLRLLRCSTLPESPNPNPNPSPNPNFSSVSSSSSSSSVLASVELSSKNKKPHFLLPPSTCLSLTPPDKEKKFALEFLQNNSKKVLLPLAKEDEFKTMKTQNIMSLDLEMGCLKDRKEDVDLELRLGYV